MEKSQDGMMVGSDATTVVLFEFMASIVERYITYGPTYIYLLHS